MKKNTKKIDDIPLQEYSVIFGEIKKQIKEAQIKATLSVNKQLLILYWFIGKTIAEQEEKNKWGTHFIEKLAQDLQKEFPGMKGFSRSNVFYIRSFYKEYEIV